MGPLSGHKSVTSILPNNPMMLPLFSIFMNFHPNLSGSCIRLISGLELLLLLDTTDILHTAVIRHLT